MEEFDPRDLQYETPQALVRGALLDIAELVVRGVFDDASPELLELGRRVNLRLRALEAGGEQLRFYS